ncbi:HNH endonuclease [Clostridium botulinum]|uniref:HNH endonuclease domain protein n=1 Tax=Clostridium botulinum (strain 657 / Type Ba4) TaxID=515621 RepID=A0A3F2ZSG9_CLOB6|nr:HNH endonuclease signature motif containing protein [Clostridium botulinum]ACQ54142.1 HNH endonuclease domain protein [Clostridium botulinum Ba4 str. 657]AXG90527.1 HNH endonuclease [Clostridium botulinum]MBY6757001.1 HNH endonuclease [Clostridium botulinum]RFM20607.1 HNH endonuclease [Clostridium botulinum]
MVKYDEAKKHAHFNGYTFTRDEKTGYYLSTKPTKENKRQRLHVYVWEFYNGRIPEGYEVHHKDEDKGNNDISNFELLLGLKHRKLHGYEFSQDEKRVETARKIIKEKAQPKAIEWHGSKEGREWHKEHYENVKDKFHIKEKYICEYCGITYETQKGRNKFCSNKCKSAWRRKQGLDNEIRVCVICGKEFECNKYSKAKTCSRKCRGELRRLNKQKLKE